MRDNGQILLRYCDAEGDVSAAANPNGSSENIAGICNENGNVFALMPHPERCAEPELGGVDGLGIWQAMVLALSPRLCACEPSLARRVTGSLLRIVPVSCLCLGST